jgi:hypothetical protein
MGEPVIFINTYRLKEGKLDAYAEAARAWFAWNEADHPRLLHHQVYAGDDGVEVVNVQVHPDSESLELQMQLVADVHGAWHEYIDWATMSILLCGAPSDHLRKELERLAGSGVPVNVKAAIDGFSRLPAL